MIEPVKQIPTKTFLFLSVINLHIIFCVCLCPQTVTSQKFLTCTSQFYSLWGFSGAYPLQMAWLWCMYIRLQNSAVLEVCFRLYCLIGRKMFIEPLFHVSCTCKILKRSNLEYLGGVLLDLALTPYVPLLSPHFNIANILDLLQLWTVSSMALREILFGSWI